MTLAGEGAVAIWHDIEPEGREIFYAWHGEEHMPERLGIPGFMRGRRYVAIDADLEFFNLYEALSFEVLIGSDYLARLNAPTPWTCEAVRHFRGVARAICRVAGSHGHGNGGLAATWRYDVPENRRDEHLHELCVRVLPGLARRHGVAGVHLLLTDEAASGLKTEEQKARSQETAIPRYVLILEGWGDESAFPSLCTEAFPDEMLHASGAQEIRKGIYRLQNTRLKTAWSP